MHRDSVFALAFLVGIFRSSSSFRSCLTRQNASSPPSLPPYPSLYQPASLHRENSSYATVLATMEVHGLK